MYVYVSVSGMLGAVPQISQEFPTREMAEEHRLQPYQGQPHNESSVVCAVTDVQQTVAEFRRIDDLHRRVLAAPPGTLAGELAAEYGY